MAKGSTTTYQITVRPQTIFLVLGVWLLIRFLVQIQHAVILFCLACILASALYPVVLWLNKKSVPRKFGILIVYLVMLLLGAGGMFLVGNVILQEGRQFVADLPAYANNAIRQLNALPFLQIDSQFWTTLSNYAGNFTNRIIHLVLSGVNYFLTAIQGVFSIITILVFSFFLLSDTQYFEKKFLRFFNPAHQDRIQKLLSATALHIGAYARGQFFVMSATGLLTWLGLSLVGVPYAFILGVLVFLLDIVPIIGPILAASVGILIALAESPMLALWAGLVYLIVQQIESYLLYPAIVGKATGLHPFWILFSLLIGGILLGIAGVLLAVPAAILLTQLLEMAYPNRMQVNANAASEK